MDLCQTSRELATGLLFGPLLGYHWNSVGLLLDLYGIPVGSLLNVYGCSVGSSVECYGSPTGAPDGLLLDFC